MVEKWVGLAGIVGFVKTEFFSNFPSSGQAMIQWWVNIWKCNRLVAQVLWLV